MQQQLSFGNEAIPVPPVAERATVREPSVPAPSPPSVGTLTTRTVVYTDGACSGNPGPGGWAWAVPGGAWARGAEATSTNQRMELSAVLEAVRSLPGPLEVVSDSTYVVNCFRDRWWAGWQKRNWRNSQNKPVANRDIWEPLIGLVIPRDIVFRWVKGHGTDPINGYVDELAVKSARTQTADIGQSSPNSPSRRPARNDS